jgi:hypothetical protein
MVRLLPVDLGRLVEFVKMLLVAGIVAAVLANTAAAMIGAHAGSVPNPRPH